MGTRADLLAAAAKAASAASAENSTPDDVHAYALAAKTALEAAALAEDVPVSDVDAALAELHAELVNAGALPAGTKPGDRPPAELLRYLAGLASAFADQDELIRQLGGAYERLWSLAAGLQRDYSASDSETARRYAARIATAMEEAQALAPPADVADAADAG